MLKYLLFNTIILSTFFVSTVFSLTGSSRNQMKNRVELAGPTFNLLLTNTNHTVLKDSKTLSHITLESMPPIEVIEAEIPFETVSELFQTIEGFRMPKVEQKASGDFLLDAMINDDFLAKIFDEKETIKVKKLIGGYGSVRHEFYQRHSSDAPVLFSFMYHAKTKKLFFMLNKNN